MTNSQGVPTGPNGFVLCLNCTKEVQDISREVSSDYAFCVNHRAQHNNKKETAMSKAKRESKKPIPAPMKFLKDLLGNEPITREQVIKKLEKAGYAKGTISTQVFQLRHWKGCIAQEDGFVKNPNFEEPVKEVKEKKVKVKKNSIRNVSPKVRKAKTFHPAPKPSQA